MSGKRIFWLICFLAVVAAVAAGGWWAGSRIVSPAEAAARTAPPSPSPILVPVERRVLSSKVVTRGTARFGLPQPISLAPSPLKPTASVITSLPQRNAQLQEGSVMLTSSARPVFVLQGETPVYRDLVPGAAGNDVRQLEQALKRLGFDPGAVDETYDGQTSAAVAQWYKSAGWEPFAATAAQLAEVRAVEDGLAEAKKGQLAASNAAAASELAVRAARAKADHAVRVAAAELAVKQVDLERVLKATRDKADFANKAAQAEIAAKIAERAHLVVDPRSTLTAREAAEAQIQLARAAAINTRLEGELSVLNAERDALVAAEQLKLAEAAVAAAELEGQAAVQAAVDAQKVAEFDASLAAERAARLAADLEKAKGKLGVQVPLDEVVFLPALPVRVEEVSRMTGDVASGPVLSVTNNQLVVDSSLPLNTAALVKAGMPARIDEPSLGIDLQGTVELVASTPGTHGVDGYHVYMELRIDKTAKPLQGFSMRVTIPIQSTQGAVTAVPVSAVTLATDGHSRVQVQKGEALEYVVVRPGLSADGFVEVTPVEGSLEPGQLVVVGYEFPDNSANAEAGSPLP